MTSYNALTEAEAEVLALLAEECSEVVQAVTKILRHGLLSEHPATGERNIEALSRETGQVLAVIDILYKYDLLRGPTVALAHATKMVSLPRYLHHADVRGP